MTQLSQAFAANDSAEQFAHALYPSARSVTLVKHSYDNIVALVDNTYAVRFPRNKDSSTRSRYEQHILSQLENASTIMIPKIISSGINPSYLVTSFVPGRHISTQTLKTLSANLQNDFAKQIARFAYAMHSSLVLENELKIRGQLGLDELAEEPWSVHFKKTIVNQSLPTVEQDKIAKEYYARWDDLCNVNPQVVVHDDLHTENMFFNGDNRLIGILDFGDTNIGTPEQDLRQLYRVSESVLLTALNEYEALSGKRLNAEAAKTWAVTQELAVYAEQLSNANTSHRTFKRACRNLNAWLGKGGWGTGYDISDTEGYQ